MVCHKASDLGEFDHAESEGCQFTFTADRGIYLAPDGLSRGEELFNVVHKKRRLNPNTLSDHLAQWIDEEAARFPAAVAEATDTPDAILGKCKDYASSVDPMSLWRAMKAFFLDEVLRHEGLGEDLDAPECAHCHAGFPDGNADGGPRLFKCEDCGEFLQCHNCCVANHVRMPLHVIKEWTGDYWTPCTLADIGLVYQLGHGGFPCEFPSEYGVQNDDYRGAVPTRNQDWYPATVTDPKSCATFRSLESYRLYNLIGNMNVNDYTKALEQMTDVSAAAGMRWLPDRYRQFQRMARQWAFLMHLKQAGLGHDPGGLNRSFFGDCAVLCWACPFDGRNLPPNWREVEPKYWFLYMLLLADTNVRLKNRMHPNEIYDPFLGPGWGYWVEPERYKHHLRKYVNEKDVSTCIAFSALLQKDTRLTTGLRVSGVRGCVCSRHECMKPNGLGDLQKGCLKAPCRKMSPSRCCAWCHAWCPSGTCKTGALGFARGVTAGGKAPLHGRSATAFLVAGIQIEDAQQRITAELRGRVLVAVDRESRVAEWRHALLVKIAKTDNQQAGGGTRHGRNATEA
ncbi:hypothetical protein C8R43DRAFT_953502 [Mycena crocata]|nr:hypothetical protein C8R43DRAFT_953502 [Mycena crocata]